MHIGAGGTRTPAPVHVNPRPGFSRPRVPASNHDTVVLCHPQCTGLVPLGWDPFLGNGTGPDALSVSFVPLPDVVNVGRTDHARTTQAETGADVHRDMRARLR
jgi:hypothetical protein